MMLPQKVSTSQNGGSGRRQTSAFRDVKGRRGCRTGVLAYKGVVNKQLG